MVHADYDKLPVKPCMDGEPNYEDHPINWDPANGWFNQWDVRRAAYQSVFAGAMGVTYGCHSIWQFLDKGRTAITSARHTWTEDLNLPGASQMIWLRQLMESEPYFSRVPDQSLIIADESGFTNRIVACRGMGYGLIYLPANKGVNVKLALVGPVCKVSWFNPRNGTKTEQGVFNDDEKYFEVPVQGVDWVLVIEVMNG